MLRDRRGDMVWNAIVVAAVALPLLALIIDGVRYFAFRTALQNAADAAAAAAVRCVDVRAFQATGVTRLDPACAYPAALDAFFGSTADLLQKGYAVRISEIRVEDDRVSVAVEGTMRVFFDLSPRLAVRAAAVSMARMRR